MKERKRRGSCKNSGKLPWVRTCPYLAVTYLFLLLLLREATVHTRVFVQLLHHGALNNSRRRKREKGIRGYVKNWSEHWGNNIEPLGLVKIVGNFIHVTKKLKSRLCTRIYIFNSNGETEFVTTVKSNGVLFPRNGYLLD